MPILDHTRLSHVTVVVRDQEEALQWYCQILGFEKRMDDARWPTGRLLTVSPPGQRDLQIMLQAPNMDYHGPERAEHLAASVGKGPMLVLTTPDCRAAHWKLVAAGVRFWSEPSELPWGVSAVFEDLYGNPFYLLQPAPEPPLAADEV